MGNAANTVRSTTWSRTFTPASLPTNIRLHVGCGGSPSSWWSDNRTPSSDRTIGSITGSDKDYTFSPHWWFVYRNCTDYVAYREFFQNLSKAVAEFNYPGGAGADHVRVGVAATYLHRT
jgi:hypothetical protein